MPCDHPPLAVTHRLKIHSPGPNVAFFTGRVEPRPCFGAVGGHKSPLVIFAGWKRGRGGVSGACVLVQALSRPQD